MKNLKQFLLLLILFGINQPTKSYWFLPFSKKTTSPTPIIAHKFDPAKSAFISDFHDVLTKPERQKKAFPAFWAMSHYNKAKFIGRVVQYYFNQLVTSNLSKNDFKKCNEFFTLPTKFTDQDLNYQENAIRMLNSDTIIQTNVDFLTEQKKQGAYIAICSNIGPQSTKFVNDQNGKFLDQLCTNHDNYENPAIWTPNSETGFVKKHYPNAQSYLTILAKLAACRPDTEVIVVLDDKAINLAAAQAALTSLQIQEPPALRNTKIVPIKIKNSEENFVETVKRTLNLSIGKQND